MARERQMPMRRRRTSEREQLDLFRALPGDLALRDAQDLMAYPFFSLAKSKRTGWSFDLIHLRAKSDSLSPLKHFVYEIVRRERLPGFQLVIERGSRGTERLNFTPIPVDPLTAALRRRGLATRSGDEL
jgi:plasmid replication initiation protein